MSTTAAQTGTAIQSVKSFKPEDFKKAQPFGVLKQMGDAVKSSVADALPGFLRNQAPAMMRALFTECQKNPQLLNSSPESLFGCTIAAAQMGLMLGSSLGQCYLVPFKGRINLVVGYKGYIQLVNRSGQTGVINAFTVFDKDTFSYEFGSNPKVTHLPGRYETAKEVMERKAVAYYATCLTKQGATFQVMTKPEAEVHREKFALAKNGPWATHFDAMAMKTCIIKLCKYLPMSAELQTAIHTDEMADNGDPVDASFLFRDALQIEDVPQPKTESLTNRLAEVKGNGVASPADGQLFPGDEDYEKAQKADEQKRQHAATV